MGQQGFYVVIIQSMIFQRIHHFESLDPFINEQAIGFEKNLHTHSADGGSTFTLKRNRCRLSNTHTCLTISLVG